MPGNCILAHCKEKNASLHSFPLQNEALNSKWTSFVRAKRQDFQRPTKHSKLCSDHFVDGDFANLLQYRLGIANRRLLKEDAVPSVHVSSNTEEGVPTESTQWQWSAGQTITTCVQSDALKTFGAAPVPVIKTENDPEPAEATSHPDPTVQGLPKPADAHTQVQVISVKQEPPDEEACCAHHKGGFPSTGNALAMSGTRAVGNLQREQSDGLPGVGGMERPHHDPYDGHWSEETAVQLGPAFLQWRALRAEMQMSSDAQLAMFLLNKWNGHPTAFQELALSPSMNNEMTLTNSGLSSGTDLGMWSPGTPVESSLHCLMPWHPSPEGQCSDLKEFPLLCLSADRNGKPPTLHEALNSMEGSEAPPWNMTRAPEQPVFPLRSPLRHARISPGFNKNSLEVDIASAHTEELSHDQAGREAEQLEFSSEISTEDSSAPKSLLRKMLTSPSTIEHLRVNALQQTIVQSKQGVLQTRYPASSTWLRNTRAITCNLEADKSSSGCQEMLGVQGTVSGGYDEKQGRKDINSKDHVINQDTNSGSWQSDDFDLFSSSEGNNGLGGGDRRKRKIDDSDEEWMPTDILSDSDDDNTDLYNKRMCVFRRRAAQQKSKASSTGGRSEERRQRSAEEICQNSVNLNHDSKEEICSRNGDVSFCKLSVLGGGEKEFSRASDFTVSAWKKG